MATKWFDRKFDFSFGMEQYASIYQRLKDAPEKYSDAVKSIPGSIQVLKPENKWSVKENVGHVVILELLWQTRILEIRDRKAALSPADLTNKATDDALFNEAPLNDLLNSFSRERNKTITILDNLQPQDFLYSSKHPRLQTPMRVIDTMYFVAEHDTHHLNSIRDIVRIT